MRLGLAALGAALALGTSPYLITAAFAQESPLPLPEEITTDIYWEGDHAEQTMPQGMLIFE